MVKCDDSKPYIFISYSHKDTEAVLEIVSCLTDNGYNCWYDDGIDPGTEWDENIAYHINHCAYFIAFVSANYINSNNCKDELNYSRDLDKDQLLVYLEDVALPQGMAMRMNRLQAIWFHKYADSNYDEAYKKLFSAQGIDKGKLSATNVNPELKPFVRSRRPRYNKFEGKGVPAPKKMHPVKKVLFILSLILLFFLGLSFISNFLDYANNQMSEILNNQVPKDTPSYIRNSNINSEASSEGIKYNFGTFTTPVVNNNSNGATLNMNGNFTYAYCAGIGIINFNNSRSHNRIRALSEDKYYDALSRINHDNWMVRNQDGNLYNMRIDGHLTELVVLNEYTPVTFYPNDEGMFYTFLYEKNNYLGYYSWKSGDMNYLYEISESHAVTIADERIYYVIPSPEGDNGNSIRYQNLSDFGKETASHFYATPGVKIKKLITDGSHIYYLGSTSGYDVIGKIDIATKKELLYRTLDSNILCESINLYDEEHIIFSGTNVRNKYDTGIYVVSMADTESEPVEIYRTTEAEHLILNTICCDPQKNIILLDCVNGDDENRVSIFTDITGDFLETYYTE